TPIFWVTVTREASLLSICSAAMNLHPRNIRRIMLTALWRKRSCSSKQLMPATGLLQNGETSYRNGSSANRNQDFRGRFRCNKRQRLHYRVPWLDPEAGRGKEHVD